MTTPAAPTPPAEPREVTLDASAPRRAIPRPAGVYVVTLLGLALAALGAYAVFANPPDEPVLLLTASLLILLYAYVHWGLFRGEGWARSARLAIAGLGVSLALVAVATAAGDGELADSWRIPVAILLVEGLVAAYLLTSEARAWFTPVAWRESLADVKWAIALLFLTMLGLFGVNHAAWDAQPRGREDLGALVRSILSGDSQGLGNEIPLVFVLQLLGILLVAALIASVVLAMRDPAPGEETEAP